MRILIVDDHAPARKLIAGCLTSLPDLEIHEAASLTAARQVLAQQLIDVALIDLRLDASDADNRDGMELVRELRQGGTAVPIVVTASSEMAEIRGAMRAGAYAYILKDELSEELVRPVLAELQSRRALEREVLQLHGFVGVSQPMERLRRVIKKVAAVDSPVLILGPTGSGKELVARAIHALSPRRAQPLVTVNCGGLNESLVEAQLFGHAKGAFTGAAHAHPGYFAQADRGMLFLDEVAELPAELQPKLLRALENRTYRSIGTTSDSRFEGRIVAATHVDLAERVAAKRFRADLYYRLEVLTVRLPSLAERQQDIPALVEHLAKETPRPLRFTAPALSLLERMDWPGNVRQLRNLVHRLSVFVEHDLITAEDVQLYCTPGADDESDRAIAAAKKGQRTVAEELLRGVSQTHSRRENQLRLEQNQVRVLDAEGRDDEEVCRIMGIARATLFRIRSGRS